MDVAKWIHSLGGNPNWQNVEGYVPLYMTVENGHLNVVNWLLSIGANTNIATSMVERFLTIVDSGIVPLHVGAEKGHVKVVERLLEAGADVNYTSKSGITPIQNASNKAEVAKLLYEHGAIVPFTLMSSNACRTLFNHLPFFKFECMWFKIVIIM